VRIASVHPYPGVFLLKFSTLEDSTSTVLRWETTMDYNQFQYTTGGQINVSHIELIDVGGYGEVHKVCLQGLVVWLMVADAVQGAGRPGRVFCAETDPHDHRDQGVH
jgi:hypothetical protein